MRFTHSLLFALAAPYLVIAQSGNENTFIIPTTGLQATAGEPLSLKWNPTTSGTVSLILRSGSSNNLAEGTTIASKVPNSGSYTWTPAPDTVRGSDYTIQIVSDSDPSKVNYTPYFVLESDNTVAPAVTSLVSLAAPTSSLDLSTAPLTSRPSAYPTTDDINTSASASMASSSATNKATSAATGTASRSASASAPSTTGTSGAAGVRTTAMVGTLGAAVAVVAFGALVL